MQQVHLLPARGLLEGLTREELRALARRSGLRLAAGTAKAALIESLSSHADLDELAARLVRQFPKRRPAGCRKPAAEVRLDRARRLHGSVTVQTYSRTNPGLGHLLLGHRDRCLALRLEFTQLFLENRWPVLARDAGCLPIRRLYAAYIARGAVHPEARMPPPGNRPFVLDEGEYGLRLARLRLELKRSGPLSFRVEFLRYRPPAGRPEYLLQPIA